jgi:triosephosphate isomerase
MRRIVLVGNWKMNEPNSSSSDLTKLFQTTYDNKLDIIAPPATLLSSIKARVSSSKIMLAGQDCHKNTEGSYTGDISARLLKDAGANYVILGHSERRIGHKESNRTIMLKAKEAIRQDLTPILCVGESLMEYHTKTTLEVIKRQLRYSLNKEIINRGIIIAYEPVWAIGSNKIPSSEEIERVHSFIRKYLSTNFGASIGNMCRIIYGGSVNHLNASEIFKTKDVDGALVGGASLKIQDFLKIINLIGKL